MSPDDLTALFGSPIHTYTAQQAVEDGLLVDAHQDPRLSEVTRQHLSSTTCYLSAGLLALVERAVAHPKACNDFLGVWHDVLSLAKFFANRGRYSRARLAQARLPELLEPGEVLTFSVVITGTGRRRRHDLRVGFDGEAITICLPEED
jgi:hypothetical protein